MKSPSASSTYSFSPGKPVLLRFVPGEGKIKCCSIFLVLQQLSSRCHCSNLGSTVFIHDSWVHTWGRCWDLRELVYLEWCWDTRRLRECGYLCKAHLTRGYRCRPRPLEKLSCVTVSDGSSGFLPVLAHPASAFVGLADLLREVPSRHQEVPEVRPAVSNLIIGQIRTLLDVYYYPFCGRSSRYSK